MKIKWTIVKKQLTIMKVQSTIMKIQLTIMKATRLLWTNRLFWKRWRFWNPVDCYDNQLTAMKIHQLRQFLISRLAVTCSSGPPATAASGPGLALSVCMRRRLEGESASSWLMVLCPFSLWHRGSMHSFFLYQFADYVNAFWILFFFCQFLVKPAFMCFVPSCYFFLRMLFNPFWCQGFCI